MKSPRTIVYVTRDRERATGAEESEKYLIVSNEKGQTLDTYELLKTERVEKLMKENADVAILVFQNTKRIERFCTEKGWKLLNPKAELSKKIEEKISQYEWLGDARKFLPPTEIKKISEIKFADIPFVIQFNHAHTGTGTHIISDKKTLSEIKDKFPDRPARVSGFVRGPAFTLNVIVAQNGIFFGNISYQITGLSDFTDIPSSTVGNDWKLPNKILSEKEREKILDIAERVGEKMKKDGWLGLFGIDVILDEKTRDIFLIEINARQPASVTCESLLQKTAGDGVTIFQAHLLSLLGEKINGKIQEIPDGAQIILRIKASGAQNVFLENSLRSNILEKHSASSRLSDGGFSFIRYENTKHNADLLRVRSNKGIMESDGKLNAVGKEISSLIFKK